MSDCLCLLKPLFRKSGPLAVIYKYFRLKYKGLRLYKRLIKKYGADTVIIFASFEGIGDVYIAGCLFGTFLQQKKIRDYVVLEPRKEGCEVLENLGIGPIECITREEKCALRDFAIYMGTDFLQINIMHFSLSGHTDIMCGVEGINNIDFFSMFTDVWLKKAVFVPSKIKTELLAEKLNKFFVEKGIVKGRTVIIFPKASSIKGFSQKMWKEIADELQSMGFVVCTNVLDGEKEIEGTIPVNIPIMLLTEVIEKAGFFLGIRSGICDLVSAADCNKFVLYPQAFKWGRSTMDKYFRLSNSKLNSQVSEICVMNEKDGVQKVLIAFQEIEQKRGKV